MYLISVAIITGAQRNTTKPILLLCEKNTYAEIMKIARWREVGERKNING